MLFCLQEVNCLTENAHFGKNTRYRSEAGCWTLSPRPFEASVVPVTSACLSGSCRSVWKQQQQQQRWFREGAAVSFVQALFSLRSCLNLSLNLWHHRARPLTLPRVDPISRGINRSMKLVIIAAVCGIDLEFMFSFLWPNLHLAFQMWSLSSRVQPEVVSSAQTRNISNVFFFSCLRPLWDAPPPPGFSPHVGGMSPRSAPKTARLPLPFQRCFLIIYFFNICFVCWLCPKKGSLAALYFLSHCIIYWCLLLLVATFQN